MAVLGFDGNTEAALSPYWQMQREVGSEGEKQGVSGEGCGEKSSLAQFK